MLGCLLQNRLPLRKIWVARNRKSDARCRSVLFPRRDLLKRNESRRPVVISIEYENNSMIREPYDQRIYCGRSSHMLSAYYPEYIIFL